MEITLQHCINRINGALEDLGQRKAYDIKHPHYNYRGYCMGRIVAGTVALGLGAPTDVPAWDLELDRYVPRGFFWMLWAWNLNNQGDPERELEDLVDDHLGLPAWPDGRWTSFSTPGGTVLGQVAALKDLHDRTFVEHRRLGKNATPAFIAGMCTAMAANQGEPVLKQLGMKSFP